MPRLVSTPLDRRKGVVVQHECIMQSKNQPRFALKFGLCVIFSESRDHARWESTDANRPPPSSRNPGQWAFTLSRFPAVASMRQASKCVRPIQPETWNLVCWLQAHTLLPCFLLACSALIAQFIMTNSQIGRRKYPLSASLIFL